MSAEIPAGMTRLYFRSVDGSCCFSVDCQNDKTMKDLELEIKQVAHTHLGLREEGQNLHLVALGYQLLAENPSRTVNDLTRQCVGDEWSPILAVLDFRDD